MFPSKTSTWVGLVQNSTLSKRKGRRHRSQTKTTLLGKWRVPHLLSCPSLLSLNPKYQCQFSLNSILNNMVSHTSHRRKKNKNSFTVTNTWMNLEMQKMYIWFSETKAKQLTQTAQRKWPQGLYMAEEFTQTAQREWPQWLNTAEEFTQTAQRKWPQGLNMAEEFTQTAQTPQLKLL